MATTPLMAIITIMMVVGMPLAVLVLIHYASALFSALTQYNRTRQDYAILQEDYAILKENCALLEENYSMLEKNYATLQEGYAMLEEKYGSL
jgi:cell division protein FtsB